MTCAARFDSAGQFRCAKCKIAWDRDDPMVCPQEIPLQVAQPVVATRAHDECPKRSAAFVSALAPDPWRK